MLSESSLTIPITTAAATAGSDGGSGAAVILIPLFLILGVAVYFVPSVIAAARGHHQTAAIVAINAFLGWLLIGWVVALAMALSAKRAPALPPSVVQVGYPVPPPPPFPVGSPRR